MARRGKLKDRGSRHDSAYRRAKEEGYAGRAIYKLEEIDKRFRLLQSGRRVIDLGCWPGSWMQYVAEKVGEDGFVLGLDKRPVEIALPAHAKAFTADVFSIDPAQVTDTFGDFDVLLSDMAPKTTGDRATDMFRSEELTRRALDFATSVLRPGGHFCAKVFVGGGFKQLLADVGKAFSECKPIHPKNTRAGSYEQYVIGRGLKAGAQTRGPSSPA
ncbi:MAG: RlmE family RNA methyltransferase [Myxococcota bacterium]